MKTELKEVKVDLEVEATYSGCSSLYGGSSRTYKYSFTTHKHFTPKIFEEVEVSDSLKEFRESKGLSKSELVEWLNKNY